MLTDHSSISVRGGTDQTATGARTGTAAELSLQSDDHCGAHSLICSARLEVVPQRLTDDFGDGDTLRFSAPD